MEHDKISKLRSSILDKICKCDEVYDSYIKFNHILIIDTDVLSQNNIESLNLSKKITFYDNVSDSLNYLSSSHTIPDIIFIDEKFLGELIEKFNFNKETTKLVVLTSLTNTINTIFDIIHKPISYSAIQKLIK